MKLIKEYCIAITGSIATGKSTVAKMIAANGYPVIDADKLAREVVEPETEGLQMIADTFGDHVITSSGELDRQALKAIVFDDREKLKTLEGITHPLIRNALIDKLASQEIDNSFVFYEASLIFEKNLQDDFKLVIATTCSLETQVSRLMQRDNVSKETAYKIIATQMPAAEKAALADYVFDTSKTAEELNTQISKLLKKLHNTR